MYTSHMPNVHVWIRKSNEKRWNKIKHKSAWVNDMLVKLDSPPDVLPDINNVVTDLPVLDDISYEPLDD